MTNMRCQNGHPFDEANTYRDTAGRRQCLACKLESQRQIRADTGRPRIRDYYAREARPEPPITLPTVQFGKREKGDAR
jgi:hypothetical protein